MTNLYKFSALGEGICKDTNESQFSY